MKNIIFIAAPATGKGTFSNMLMERYGYSHISTGDLLRNIVKTNTSLGNEVANVLKSGKLVEDELMFKIIKEKLNQMDLTKPFIIDGLPRNINQALYLNKLFDELNVNNFVAINLDLEYEVALKRALGRLSCLNCGATYNNFFEKFKPKKENICDKCGNVLDSRTDDNEESFKERFETYQNNVKPILDYYMNNNNLLKINTHEFTNEEIFDIIINAVK